MTDNVQDAGVQTGAALADLYERHAPAAGRLAYLLTGDRGMAEDLTQEAFVRVVGRFRHEGPTPEIDAIWNLLRRARDSVQRWAGHHWESLETFSLDEAVGSLPDVPWNASGAGKLVPNQVSIRGVAPAGGSVLTGWSGWDLVLVSITPDLDRTYRIAVNIDEHGGGDFRYGTQDATTYEGCREGWG